ncbi:MAG: sialate O-acetylesterase [Akkermansiaceae bacterium]
MEILKKRPLHVVFLTSIALASPLSGEVKPNPLFAAGAVLQRDREVPVWGTARDGEKVTVELNDQKVITTAAGGKWSVKLKPQAAGGPFTLKISGDNVVTIENVLVGEVWVCSGQSNMQFPLGGATSGAREIPKANYPKIRLFSVPRKTAVKPVTEAEGTWAECTPETARHFSAVAYFFGRDLHQKLGVPIGLIHSSWGGTPAQAWTSIEGLRKDPVLEGYVSAAAKNEQSFPAAAAAYPAQAAAYEKKLKAWEAIAGPDYEQKLTQWRQACAAAKKDGKPMPKLGVPLKPKPPVPAEGSSQTPTVVFNGMIAPIIPYGIKGAIWYQGEGNAGNGRQYRTLFPTLIADWREKWKQGDFPFLFVQLAPFNKQPPEIREAQLLTLTRSPNTAMAVTTDVGDLTDIHPKRKEPVGQRLALAARAVAYGENIEFSGPIYQSMRVGSGKAILKFTHTGTGLVAKDGPLKDFTIAGADKQFVPAQAEIRGSEIVVSSDKVAAPVAVRYAWGTFEGNLFNAEKLPASPFRTDVD